MKPRKIDFEIALPPFHASVNVFANFSEKELLRWFRAALKRGSIKPEEIESVISQIKGWDRSGEGGLCCQFYDGAYFVLLHLTKDDLETTNYVVHEMVHVAHRLLGSTLNMPLSYQTEEMYAYVIGYLSQQAMRRLRRV